MNNNTNNQGFALLITLIVVAIILAIGLTILDISTKSIALSTNSKQSELAFHAANAGLECVRYWKDEEVERENFETGADVTIDCFGVSDTSEEGVDVAITNLGTGGSVNTYKFELDYGTPSQCTQAIMAVLVSPDDANVAAMNPAPVVDFPWDRGLKTCPAFGTCTVAYVRGYNTACSNISNPNSRFIQREILLEF